MLSPWRQWQCCGWQRANMWNIALGFCLGGTVETVVFLVYVKISFAFVFPFLFCIDLIFILLFIHFFFIGLIGWFMGWFIHSLMAKWLGVAQFFFTTNLCRVPFCRHGPLVICQLHYRIYYTQSLPIVASVTRWTQSDCCLMLRGWCCTVCRCRTSGQPTKYSASCCRHVCSFVCVLADTGVALLYLVGILIII